MEKCSSYDVGEIWIMKIHSSFLNSFLKPATENHRQYVRSIYPNAVFQKGFIYDGTNRLTSTSWDLDGDEAEYYAWMWAYQHICDETLRKLEI
jgi:hypothetical protein